MSGEAPLDGPERAEAVQEENERLRHLRMIVDLTTNVLTQERMNRDEAERLVAATRRQALLLFPDKEETYDLILAPRFARIMDELFPEPEPPPPAKVLPFPNRS